MSTAPQTHAAVLIAPPVDFLIITHVDVLLFPQEAVDASISRGEKITDDLGQSLGHPAMRWPPTDKFTVQLMLRLRNKGRGDTERIGNDASRSPSKSR